MHHPYKLDSDSTIPHAGKEIWSFYSSRLLLDPLCVCSPPHLWLIASQKPKALIQDPAVRSGLAVIYKSKKNKNKTAF